MSLLMLDKERIRVDLDAYCHDCKHWHRLGLTQQGFLHEVWEWEAKHRGHDFELLSPRRHIPKGFRDAWYTLKGLVPWWLGYRSNANVKIEYAASAAITCTLTSLATSTTFIAGRESAAVDNTTNDYVDVRVTAKITTGTTPTADKEIRIYAYAALSDTPTYPDTITGADAAVSLTSVYTLAGGFAWLGATPNSNTNNIGYPIKCVTLAQAFGHAPKRWGLYVSQNTGVNLHATGTNHVLTAIGAYYTVI